MLARANTVSTGVCICIICVGARQRCALHLHTRCWRTTFVNCICILGVRVGKFGTRHEAETLKTKLEKEEQFKPFVTR